MTMKAYVHAARGICHLTAASLDLATHGRTQEERVAGADRAALLTPVAKAFSTDLGDEAASLGVQIHRGMGFVEETGAAQHMRDSRIAAIYEGANGIHGIDLVQRKLPLAGGETVRHEIAGIRAVALAVEESGAEALGATAARLVEATDALDQADMHRWLESDQQSALAGASQYLRLFGLTLGARAWRKPASPPRCSPPTAIGANSGASALLSSRRSFFPSRRASRAPSPRARSRFRSMRPFWRTAHDRRNRDQGRRRGPSPRPLPGLIWSSRRIGLRVPRRAARFPRDSAR
jgi:acyl-CoA dehydrogenase